MGLATRSQEELFDLFVAFLSVANSDRYLLVNAALRFGIVPRVYNHWASETSAAFSLVAGNLNHFVIYFHCPVYPRVLGSLK